MKTLLVFAHPNRKSLNGEFLNRICSQLTQNGEEIQLLDLYAEDFDPRLVFNETKHRRDMHIDPETEKYREQIRWAERMVYIYPIFWGRPPAILLGYIDKLFSTNFAYKGSGMSTEGLLKGKEVVCISTMTGPSFYPALLLGNAPKNVMKKAVFNYCGIKKVKMFQFGNMEQSGNHIEKKLAKVEHFFAMNRKLSRR